MFRLFLAGLCLAFCCACTGIRSPALQQDKSTAQRMHPAVSAAQYHGEFFLRTELFFGLSMQLADGADAEITERQWQKFLDRYVTPRLPDGLTVVDVIGQWLHDGRVVKEKSKMLVLLHPMPGDASNDIFDRKIEEIRTIYKEKFHQDAVIRVTTPVGVSF